METQKTKNFHMSGIDILTDEQEAEKIAQTADQTAEIIAQIAQQEGISVDEYLRDMERQAALEISVQYFISDLLRQEQERIKFRMYGRSR